MKLLSTILAVALAFSLRSVQIRNEKAARLQDTTPIFPPSNGATYVSFLKAAVEDDRKEKQDQATLEMLADALISTVSRNHGSVEYIGRCLDVMLPSTQFSSESCDFVVKTSWDSSKDFDAFRSSVTDTWSAHQAHRYLGSAKTNILSAVGFHGVLSLVMKAYSSVTGFDYNLDTKLNIDTTADDKHYSGVAMLAKAQTILGDDEVTADSEPVYMWNWMQANKGEDEAEKNAAYVRKFLPMLTLHNGGPINTGPLEPANNSIDSAFSSLAAVYYPSRTFFGKLISSAWMYETVQNKRAGADSLSVATTPFKRST